MEVVPFVPRDMKPMKTLAENKAVSHRSQVKHRCVGGQSDNFTPESNNKLVIEWSWADGIDFASTALQMDFTALQSVGGATSTGCNINNIKDCFNQIEFWMDEVALIRTNNQNNPILNNIIYAQEASKDHAETEMEFFAGFNNQWINVRTAGTGDINRKYTLPLPFLHPLFANHNIFPILGSRMRLVLYLAKPEQVLSIRPANATYKLDNVRLITEDITYTPEYSSFLKNEIRSGSGFMYSYVDFMEQKLANTGNSTEVHTLRNKYNNALTLYLYEKPALSAYDGSANLNTYPNWVLPLATKVDKLSVRCGNRDFTFGSESASNIQDYYILFEKTSQSFSNISGSGLVRFSAYNNGDKSFAPLAISLERFNQPDTDYDVINRGLSALDAGASVDILVEMNMGSVIPSTSELYGALVHEKKLLWNAGGVQVIE
jgi:hypothetical protein